MSKIISKEYEKRERERDTHKLCVSFPRLDCIPVGGFEKRIFSLSLSLSRWTGTTHQLRDAQRRSTQLESDEACGKKKTEDASLACRIRFIVAVQQWRRLAFRRRPMKTNTVQKSERRFSTLNAESNSNLKRKTRNKIMAGFENPVRICRKDVKLREKRAAQHTASHEPQTRWYAKESERDLSMKDG